LERSGLVASRSDARRLLRQGAVEFDGERLPDEHAQLERGGVLKVGKRRFVRIRFSG